MFLDHYGTLQALEFNGLLDYNSSRSPLLVRILWQERSMQTSISPITKPFFHLPMETNNFFLFWRFNLVISDDVHLSALFSSSASTALSHPPFCSNSNEDGKSLEDEVKGVVTSRPVPWRKLLQNFVFLSMVCKDWLVLFPHTRWMTGTVEERGVSCRHPHRAWSWFPPAGWLPGLSLSPYPGRCLTPRAAAAPVPPGHPAPGWSSGMGAGCQALPWCPWGVHSHLQLHSSPALLKLTVLTFRCLQVNIPGF